MKSLLLLCMLVCNAQEMEKFSSVKIEFDGMSDIKISHGKYKLDCQTKDECNKQVFVKDDVLHVIYTKKRKMDNLNIFCNIIVPDSVKLIVVDAGVSNVIVSSYKNALKLRVGKLMLDVASLSELSVSAGSAKVKAGALKLARFNAGSMMLNCALVDNASVTINAGKCEADISVFKKAKVAYDISGFMKVKSHLPNYVDTLNKVNCLLFISCPIGRLSISELK